MKIGELAARAGCDVQTVRFYEREGLLEEPEREASGYRRYGERHVERVKFIRHCRALDLPLNEIRPLGVMIDESIVHESLIAKLSAVFGLLGLVLASIGLYGVMAFTIARRTNEIGIRMAMGASSATVLWMVLRETLLLALAGVALGVPAALLAARFLSTNLFGLSATDPSMLVTATIILIAVAGIAGALPGSRATRVQPTEALRYG